MSDKILVIIVTVLIMFLHLSSQWFVIMPWMQWTVTVDSLLWLLIFNSLTFMVYWTYYLACTTDPGQVPVNWVPPAGSPAYCRKCNHNKPPRTHHCSTCKRCTLKMDHHCPWVNNCVGFCNYASFYRFLVYVVLACGWLFWTLCRRTIHLFGELNSYEYARYRLGFTDKPPVETVEIVMLIVNLVADLLVILPVAVLCAYQTYYISTNTTTIESWEKDRVQSMCRRKILPPCPFPYDLGLLRNFRSVLGGNFLLWLWPLYSADGDGINFETKAGFKGVWPPSEASRDYAIDDDDEEAAENADVTHNVSIDYASDEEDDLLPLGKRFLGPRIRRGSEGYEVKPFSAKDREISLRHNHGKIID